ncbi:hypothetical protein SAMN05443665_1001219 [Actinomadura meyerae]|jgi:hypothetical protein|uniref:Sporulation and spore germination n=1 Tax=Actinomadura meyerae TaxID=240840 RepID=A0A239C4Z9_9ACTN|nr:hypothetical protein [Actinomadura meyerae]SNS14982.1 hypothetical protein SAMN05443665_1001219 [Actinomadura meyerae]
MRPPRVLAVLAACAALAGCGIRPTGTIRAGGPPSAAAYPATVTVYLVHGGRLRAVTRPGLPGEPHLGIGQLSVPPTTRERDMGLRTEIRERLVAYSVVDEHGPVTRRAILVVRPAGRPDTPRRWSRTALAQIACTAQAVPGIDRVNLSSTPKLDGTVWTSLACDDFADLLE